MSHWTTLRKSYSAKRGDFAASYLSSIVAIATSPEAYVHCSENNRHPLTLTLSVTAPLIHTNASQFGRAVSDLADLRLIPQILNLIKMQ